MRVIILLIPHCSRLLAQATTVTAAAYTCTAAVVRGQRLTHPLIGRQQGCNCIYTIASTAYIAGETPTTTTPTTPTTSDSDGIPISASENLVAPVVVPPRIVRISGGGATKVTQKTVLVRKAKSLSKSESESESESEGKGGSRSSTKSSLVVVGKRDLVKVTERWEIKDKKVEEGKEKKQGIVRGSTATLSAGAAQSKQTPTPIFLRGPSESYVYKRYKPITITTLASSTISTTITTLKMSTPIGTPQGSPYTSYAIITLLRKLPYKTLDRTKQHLVASYFDLQPFFTKPPSEKWIVYEDVDVNGRVVLLVTVKQAWKFLDYVEKQTGVEIPKHPKANYTYKWKMSRLMSESCKDGIGVEKVQLKKVAEVGELADWDKLLAERGLPGGSSGNIGTGGGWGGGGGSGERDNEAKKIAQAERAERVKKESAKQREIARLLLGMREPVEEGTATTTTSVTDESLKVEGLEKPGDGGVKLPEDNTIKIHSQTITSSTGITASTPTTNSSPDTTTTDPSLAPDTAFFVCIDVESWERDHRAITEVGIATLDMSLLPPRTDRTYADILPYLSHRHIRIRDHKNLRNGRFVNDAADLFDFGKSEFHSLADLPGILSKVFAPQTSTSPSGAAREVCFVAHDATTDLKYLREQCGYDPMKMVSGLKVFDTAEMYKGITGDRNTTSLARMALDLKLEPWNLHNAGNDAAYTLRGFVKMGGM